MIEMKVGYPQSGMSYYKIVKQEKEKKIMKSIEMDISAMDIEFLKEIKNKVDLEILKREKKSDLFLIEQDEISSYELKIRNIDYALRDFKKSTNITKQIEDLGYSIVRYNKRKFAFVNFKIPEIDDEYVGFKYDTTKGLVNNFGHLLEKDFAVISKILGEENKSDK